MATKTPETEPTFDGIIRRNADIEIRSVNTEERTFEIVCSSESIDSHGDVVKQNFNLKRYQKNPVVLFMHNRFGLFDGARPEDFLPVGHSKNVRIEGGNLVSEFNVIKGTAEQEPFIDKLWRRIEQGALRSASIGFVPGTVTEKKDAHGGIYYELDENDLYEISLVPIPSNPDAVGKMAALERDFLRLRATEAEEPEAAPSYLAQKIAEAEEAAENFARISKGLKPIEKAPQKGALAGALKEAGAVPILDPIPLTKSERAPTPALDAALSKADDRADLAVALGGAK